MAADGAIQARGFMIVASPEWLVERVSANLGDYLDCAPDAAIGRPLVDLLGGEAVHGLRNQLALISSPDAVARLFGCDVDGRTFDLSIQLDRRRALVCGEAASDSERGDLIATVRGLIERLVPIKGLQPLLDDSTRQVRALTGFDRIGIYRIDGARADLLASTSRAGHSMPADLDERQAAALLAAPMLIADHGGDSVQMVPPGPVRGVLAMPDGALGELLSGRGAAAALTIPLLVDGKRWGFIACHHSRPRSPNALRRSALRLYAQMLAMRIEIALLREERG